MDRTETPEFRIAVLPGDGIGVEIMEACTKVLEIVQEVSGGFRLSLNTLAAGANYYQATGEDISESSFEEVRAADAILLGAVSYTHLRAHET